MCRVAGTLQYDLDPVQNWDRNSWPPLGQVTLECPSCGGDIRLISFITDPRPIRKILTHQGEPLDPPRVSPSWGPPADLGELVQAEDDRSLYQAAPDELPTIDIHRR